jgi:hypothetical protein
MMFTIEFFRIREKDNAHAILDRIRSDRRMMSACGPIADVRGLRLVPQAEAVAAIRQLSEVDRMRRASSLVSRRLNLGGKSWNGLAGRHR